MPTVNAKALLGTAVEPLPGTPRPTGSCRSSNAAGHPSRSWPCRPWNGGGRSSSTGPPSNTWPPASTPRPPPPSSALAAGEEPAAGRRTAFAEACGGTAERGRDLVPRAGCQACAAYVARLALDASPADVVVALTANFSAWGGTCARIAAGPHTRHGFGDAARAFFDFLAEPAPEPARRWKDLRPPERPTAAGKT
ncbi:hypothetical protein [Streptomyces sp. SID6137]|uniref:hypothetical protein n=1 Tax=Streptomyces sp. SID6137 TaxID=2690319 RepID=UPI001370C346|nr:hypothetical protein [Streptomyces sp. SID6137]